MMGELKLCDSKSLKRDILYFPKFKERADNYSKYGRRDFEDTLNTLQNSVSSISISVSKKDIDTIIEYYINIKGYKKDNLTRNDWGRYARSAKILLLKSVNDVEKIKQAIEWVSKQGYIEWTIETVVKKYQDFMVKGHKDEDVVALERAVGEQG